MGVCRVSLLYNPPFFLLMLSLLPPFPHPLFHSKNLLDFFLACLEAGRVGVGGAAGHLFNVEGRAEGGRGWLGSIRGARMRRGEGGGKGQRRTQVMEEIMLLLPCRACVVCACV